MACYHLRQAYYPNSSLTQSKKLIWCSESPLRGSPLFVPCGQCVGCRLERSRQWAVRCVNEASLYTRNCFITLTYNDKYLPPFGSLQLEDHQDFMKRYRKKFGNGIRFFHAGEYGEQFGRPHYHTLIFNSDLPDRKFLKMSNGVRLDTSQILSKLWPFGHVSVGTVTFASAAYVARYIMKKVNGNLAPAHYEVLSFDEETGEIYGSFQKKPEYCTMSRNKGIGKGWIDQYMTDVYPSDEVRLIDGRKVRPPKYYDSQYELVYPEEFAKLKEARIESLPPKELLEWNSTPHRLNVREKVQVAKLASLVRNL
jgi:hypothetical protein